MNNNYAPPPAPLAIAREWNLDALAASGAPLPRETLRLGDASGRIRSVTIDNGSNATVGVFLDRDPAGTPSYVILAGTFKTQPVSAILVGVAFQPPTGDSPRGTCYAQCSDQLLSASSGASASSANATAVWDVSSFDSGAKMGG